MTNKGAELTCYVEFSPFILSTKNIYLLKCKDIPFTFKRYVNRLQKICLFYGMIIKRITNSQGT